MSRSALVVQLAGHAGSGKTTIARGLAERMSGVHVDLDTVKSALRESGIAWDAASRASYAVIYALVDDVLSRPEAVLLVDTPSYWPEIHRTLRNSAERAGARYVFLECDADEATRADRIAVRHTRRSQVPVHGEPPTDAPPTLSEVHARPIARPEGARHITVDTRNPVDLTALVEKLRA